MSPTHSSPNSPDIETPVSPSNEASIAEATQQEMGSERGAEVFGPRTFKFWLLNLLWVPHALFVLYLIAVYAVDLPTIDQWQAELPFLEKVAKGQATLGDLVALQLEHRVATNRIAGYFVAKWFGWNQKVECMVVWLFACGCAFNVCILSSRVPCWRMSSRVLQIVLAGGLFFGVGQYASWNNCFGITWFCIKWYLLTGLVIAGTTMPFLARFSLCMALAVLSTYSSANGMLAWFLLFPALFMPSSPGVPVQKWRFILLWAVVGCLAIAGYFVGFHRPPDSPSMLTVLQEPALLCKFFLTSVGSPLAKGTGIDPILQGASVGVVILILYIAICAYFVFYRKDRELVSFAFPWVALAGYGLITGLAITLGRAKDGLIQAIESRFVDTHVLSVIALIFLIPIVLQHVREQRQKESGRAKTAGGAPSGFWKTLIGSVTEGAMTGFSASLLTALLILHLCYSVSIFYQYPAYKRLFCGVKTSVLFAKCFADDSLLKWVWTKPAVEVIPHVEFLEAQGYLRPRLVRSPKIKDLPGSYEQRLGLTSNYGSMEQAVSPAPNVVSVSGWAVFPLRGEPADAVVLSWETEQGDATVFAIAQGGPYRDDIAEKLGNSSYRWSGWVKAFSTAALPKGNLTIRAWAFDTNSGKAFELNESITLKTQ